MQDVLAHFPMTENFQFQHHTCNVCTHPPYKYMEQIKIALSPQWLAITEDTQLIHHIGASA